MPRIRPTHTLTATTETTDGGGCSSDSECPSGATCQNGVCKDAYGSTVPPLDSDGTEDVIGGDAGDPLAVRFHPQGAGIDLGLIRAATGEDVQRSPMIEAPGALSKQLTEGDTLALASIAESFDDYDSLEAHAVIEIYGRRARPKKTIVETEEN